MYFINAELWRRGKPDAASAILGFSSAGNVGSRKRLGVRIAGIDTPELATKDMCEKLKAQKAKSLLKSLIDNAERVDVVEVKKDKYFRILGTVLVDGHPVGEELIRRDLAYRYHGEGKVRRNWCDSN